MNITFTRNKQADMLILEQLDNKDLVKACRTNKYTRELCLREDFWLNRIVKRYGKDSLSAKRKDETYKNFFTKKRYHIISLCKALRNNAVSNMVVNTFYDPVSGFLNQRVLRNPELIEFLLLKIFLKYERRVGSSRASETEKALNIYNRKLMNFSENVSSFNTDYLTNSDIKIFLKIIDYDLTRQILIPIITAKQKLANELNRILPLHEAVKFIIYIHNGFRTDILPLDITWEELCKNRYILDYE